MLIPPNIFSLLLEREAFHVCPLLDSHRFIQFCKDRAIPITPQRLGKFERLGVFAPFIRIFRPDQLHKVEYVDEGRRYRDLGYLKDGEDWKGETRAELAQFGFEYEITRSWIEHGYAWNPALERPSHLASLNSEPQRHESYYSRFQIVDLHFLLQRFSLTVDMESFIEDDGITPSARTSILDHSIVKDVQDAIRSKIDAKIPRTLAPLCQLISDRYYPKTQTDERRFTLSTSEIGLREWDWYEFARNWDANEAAALFDLTERKLEHAYEALSRWQQHVDPLEHWSSLVRFVSMEKRNRLKADALKAMAFREMAQMLRLLSRDAFGRLPIESNEVGIEIIHRIPDVSPDQNPLRALELVTNDFRVNPKPQLVLFVEGRTEELILPAIFSHLFGTSPSTYGIEIVNLGGVSNASGGKENPFSALWRLVDYLHHHQTIAVVLMDNEGFAAKNLKAGLPKAISTYLQHRRATRPEYIKLWKSSFEFDNFSDAEIAHALTHLGGVMFTRADIAICRIDSSASFSRRKHTLERLYETRTGSALFKPALAEALVEMMFDETGRRSPAKRPIGRFLSKVANLAARNHQPSTHAMWEYNQLTGFMGTLKPGAAARRKHPFGRARRRRRKGDGG